MFLAGILFSYLQIKESILKTKKLKIGQKFPDLKMEYLKGNRFLSSLFSKKTFLAVTNLSCRPCKQLLKKIGKFSDYLKSENIEIIVLTNNSLNEITHFKKYCNVNFEIYRVDNSILIKRLRLKNFPTLFLMDEFLNIIGIFSAKDIQNISFPKILHYFDYTLTQKRTRLAENLGGSFIDVRGVVFQKRVNSCGSACLKMILNHFCIKADLSILPKSLVNHAVCSMHDLKKAAEKNGLKALGKQLKYEDLIKIKHPVIALINRNHFTIIEKKAENRILVKDPLIGRVSFTKSAFLKIWQGKTLIFKKKPY